MSELKHYRTCVANVNYHLIFVVKYRKKVLDDVLSKELRDILNETDVNIEEIRSIFGDEITKIVIAVNKLTKIKHISITIDKTIFFIYNPILLIKFYQIIRNLSK